jgi:flagellar protein FliS
MAVSNPYQRYREQVVYTMTPGQLIVLLYDEAIKNIKKAIIYIEEKKIAQAHNCIIKAEDIINALIDNLNMGYSISEDLFSLYDYMYRQLIQANIKKDSETLKEVLSMLTEFKNTWEEAEKAVRIGLSCERKSI